MIRTSIAAAAALLLAAPAATPAFAQAISQEELEARYDRALAAGYKALFLCSAIANAERNGAARSPESVMEWELTGIQAPLDEIVRDLPYRIVRQGQADTVEDAADISSADGYVQSTSIVQRVEVEWAGDMPARMAVHAPEAGCTSCRSAALRQPGASNCSQQRNVSASPLSAAPANAALDAIAARAFETDFGEDSRTTAILVLRQGTILAEDYVRRFRPRRAAAHLVCRQEHCRDACRRGRAARGSRCHDRAGLGAGEGDPRAAITIRSRPAHGDGPLFGHQRQPHRSALLSAGPRWRSTPRTGRWCICPAQAGAMPTMIR